MAAGAGLAFALFANVAFAQEAEPEEQPKVPEQITRSPPRPDPPVNAEEPVSFVARPGIAFHRLSSTGDERASRVLFSTLPGSTIG
jgi:hypothetical protein